MSRSDVGVSRTSNGVAYRRFGSGTRIVLLHGIPGSSTSWLRVATRLAAEHEVIVPDLLGFGASSRPAGLGGLHAVAQAQAIAGMLDELGLGQVVVAGHDFGGPVAVQLAGTDPHRVSRIALFATNLFPDTPVPFPLSTVTWPRVGAAAQRLLLSRPSLRLMLRTGSGRPRVTLDAHASLGDPEQARAIRTIFAGSLRSLHELYAPIERHARALSIPALVGWGTRDPFFSVAQGERTAEALDTTLRLYPDAGHFLPEERADELAADITGLVRDDPGL